MLFLRKIILLLSLILLSGCMGGNSSNIPQDHYYRLPTPANTTILSTPLLDGTLEINAIQTRGMLHERAILFIREQQPLEVNPYHYYYWVNAPASLVQQHLIDYLQQKNLAHSQHRYRADDPADFRLEGELLHFERYMGVKIIEAQIELELVLRDNRNKQILLRKTYAHNFPAKSGEMADTANAFGLALAAIYQQFARDVATFKQQE